MEDDPRKIMHDLCKDLYSNLKVKEYQTDLQTKKLLKKNLQPKPLGVPLWAHKKTAQSTRNHSQFTSASTIDNRDINELGTITQLRTDSEKRKIWYFRKKAKTL